MFFYWPIDILQHACLWAIRYLPALALLEAFRQACRGPTRIINIGRARRVPTQAVEGMEEWACPLCTRRRGGLRTAAQRAAPTKFTSEEAGRYLQSAQQTLHTMALAEPAWDPTS